MSQIAPLTTTPWAELPLISNCHRDTTKGNYKTSEKAATTIPIQTRPSLEDQVLLIPPMVRAQLLMTYRNHTEVQSLRMDCISANSSLLIRQAMEVLWAAFPILPRTNCQTSRTNSEAEI